MTTAHVADRTQASTDCDDREGWGFVFQPWGLLVLMVSASVLVNVLAALAPAVRAARLNIVGAINRA